MYKREAPRPLTTRVYKYKKPAMKFFCPLCRTERAFTLSPRLNSKHYVQIVVISVCLMGVTYNALNWRSLLWPLFVWSAFEFAVRILFKKEIPCPHCGFDACWYKRDVAQAKSIVVNFWQQEGAEKEKAQVQAGEQLQEQNDP